MRDSEWALLRFIAPLLDNVLGALALGYFFFYCDGEGTFRLLRYLNSNSTFFMVCHIRIVQSQVWEKASALVFTRTELAVPVLRWYNVGDRKTCQVTR